MERKALRSLSYGLYIVCSKKGENFNGQIANTAIQITSTPPTIIVSINKENHTYGYINDSGVFTVSILDQDIPMETIGHFGFKSGKDIDKFQGIDYEIGTTGAPLLKDNVISQIEARVINSVSVDTHTIFAGEVVDAKIVGKGEPLTYAYYHQVKKGKAPKTAPTYQPEEEETGKKEGERYRCKVCGYIYDPEEGDQESSITPGTPFEELPSNWICPICGAGKDEFEGI